MLIQREKPEPCVPGAAVFDLSRRAEYEDWRGEKLRAHAEGAALGPVEIRDISAPSDSERAELERRCARTNMAFYVVSSAPTDEHAMRRGLRGFCDSLGLGIAEKHRSAGEQGIVALKPSDDPRQRGYIPYTRQPIGWHTDGYYNAPDERILAMVLHCVAPARDGGVNRVLDPDIAYIRLRDRDPAHVEALRHPQAMTIPENPEPDGTVRPPSIGPVFFLVSGTRLSMRYTARTRSIAWRADAATRAATAAITEILAYEPLIAETRMQAGQGLLCNNVLHMRSGFDRTEDGPSRRVMFRIRFHNRVREDEPWQS